MNRRAFLTGAGSAMALLATGVPAMAGHVTVHFYGDSITQGWAAGAFSSEIKTANPFWPVRSMWAIADTLFRENCSPYLASYLAGASLHPTPASPSPFVEAGARGILAPLDWVILEDAGKHGGDPQAYRQAWVHLINEIRTVDKVNIVMMTMFDYPPAQPLAQYDLPFGGSTMNEATTAAATAMGVRLIDMNLAMDQFRRDSMRLHGLKVMHPDGVHPNAWGQTFMAGRLLQAIGAGPYLRSAETLWSQVQPHWRAYGYAAPSWSEQKCRLLLHQCLGIPA